MKKKRPGKDLALISADVNGLKTINDTKGHAAGDELIAGAATCLLSAIAPYGRVYRTGGDEFMAIVHTPDCESLIGEIRSRTESWHGNLADGLSISLGYATRSENPDTDIRSLEKIADQRMYDDKARYYREKKR